jgi:hypothetical protein
MDTEWIESYQPMLSKGMDWRDLYKAVNDDGHVAKFVRAIKNAEDVGKAFSNREQPILEDWVG